MDDLSRCQVITTATSSATPLFEANLLSAGAHINAMGSFSKEKSELPTELMKQANVYVDTLEPCLNGSGELSNLLQQEGFQDFRPTTIGQALVDSASHSSPEVNRKNSTPPFSVFKSVGTAELDLVFAQAIYERMLGSKQLVEVQL